MLVFCFFHYMANRKAEELYSFIIMAYKKGYIQF